MSKTGREEECVKIIVGECSEKQIEPLVWAVVFSIDGANPKLINDPPYVEQSMLEIAEANELHVVESCFHKFDRYGVSGVLILAESDFSMHAWPERRFVHGAITVCYPGINLDKVVRDTAIKFGADPDKVRITELLSGTTNPTTDESFLTT